MAVRSGGLPGAKLPLVIGAGVLMVGAIVTGGLVSLPKDMPTIFKKLHKLSAILAVIGASVTL